MYPSKGTFVKTIKTKQTDWRLFADRLTALAKSEGQSRFLDQAFLFLNNFAKVDSCATFKISADKTSGAEHLCTFGTLNSNLADLLAEDYAKNGFKNDPMVQTALLSPKVRVRHLPGSQYSSSYRSQYFEKAKLIDKVSSIHTSKNVIFLVNFYRTEQHGPFNTSEFRDLERLAPIIGRFVLRHVRLAREKHVLDSAYEQRITRLVEDNTQIFSRLSPRERQVCKQILLGIEEKYVARSMKVTLSTIITHRRLYGKLNIRSKTELFQLALMALT